jgi:ABC-type Na+ efflux pump permease subunit
MGRGRYKAFVPNTARSSFVPPANGDATKKFVKPSTKAAAEAAANEVDVDKAKRRLSITSNYNITSADHFVGVNTSGGAVTLTLPATSDVAEGKIYIIKDEGGNAATNNIIINTADSAKIDSLNAVSLVSNYGAISIYFNASDWHIY